ncbi:MAG: diacylglycerol kinase (ATP) [Myxococcota bacterium]|jgi:diacylglycerol kinase (ATP)
MAVCEELMSQLGTPGHLGNIGHTNVFGREEGSGARNRNEHICLILNPRAGAGSAGENIDTLKRAADVAFENWEVRTTEGPGHAIELAREAADKDFQIIAAVGGDGTCHEVVNGLIHKDRARNRKVAFTVIPFGTGSDLMKSLKVPRRLAGALWIAATGMSLPTDVGKATVTTAEGPLTRYFINVAGFGANGEVVRRANASSKRLGGRVTFLRAAVATAARYRPAQIKLAWEGPAGEGDWEGRLMSSFLANGAYCGGGMWVGKGGNMHDGLLELSLLPPTSKARQALDMRRLYDGNLEKAAGAKRVQVRSLKATARPGEKVFIDLDGELSGMLPAQFVILPRVLNVRGGWIHNPLINRDKQARR